MYSHKKRHTNYYGQKQNKRKRNFVLEPGLKGFICTCNFREKECIKESYNILNEYADLLYGAESWRSKGNTESTGADANEQEDDDIDAALSKELSNLKQDFKSTSRFQVVESGANNCLFIKTTLPDPTELVHHIMNDVFTTKQQKSRFLLRLIPIEVTCKAYMDDILKCAAELFDKYFSKEGKTYAVVVNHRNNSNISRTAVIEEFAEMIKLRNVDNKVDLSQPDLTVIVEVIRSMCCMSIVPDYFKLLKYNLLELCGKGEKAKIAKEKEEKESAISNSENKEEMQETASEEIAKTDGIDSEENKVTGETEAPGKEEVDESHNDTSKDAKSVGELEATATQEATESDVGDVKDKPVGQNQSEEQTLVDEKPGEATSNAGVENETAKLAAGDKD